MRLLFGDRWMEGFLDPHREPGEYRVRVVAWRTLERLDALYFVRPRSLRMVANYLREIGPREVWRKIASRSGERLRNDKYLSAGLGRVLEGPVGGLPPGTAVAFLAPAHPACAERVVLAPGLVAEVSEDALRGLPSEGVLHAERPGAGVPEGVRGWSPHSGAPLPEGAGRAAAELALELARDPAGARTLEGAPSPVATSRPGRASAEAGTRAVLFGYGNYAKTLVIPNVRPWLEIERIHELDPTQIPAGAGETAWDTSPRWPQGAAGEGFRAAFLAGYHHTHAPLAAEAMDRGAAAVVEKPIATDAAQLAELLPRLERGGRLFSCYQKRYHPFNEAALGDLGVRPGDPVAYHCMVYEVPLPELHWYRWPNSRSRLVSNGCHWIDHFLHLNGYAEPARAEVAAAADGTLNASVELENGAFFTMVLTDAGSARIGVQDYVELRAGGTTVRIANATTYEAEGPDRVLRRLRVNKMVAYRRMYADIARRVVEGAPGDSARSVRVSAGLVLEMERRLHAALDAREAPLRPGAAPAEDTLTTVRS
ncbi:MAG TPA: hypothetical protein VFR81_00730 [Longimicrobium sp.]|nr:hypothetical protein [Longimicrobium sp.]